MTKPIVAAQLYTVRNFTQTAEDFAETVKKVRAMGYTGAQISAIGPIPDEDVKAIVEDEGLKICNTHTSYDLLWNDIDTVIARHKLWGCKHVAIGSMPGPYREGGEDGFKRFAEEASQVGEKLYAAGLTFSYHNHSFEFVRFGMYLEGARTGLDIIYEESDPRYLQGEIDTYWVQHGGGDPADWILRMKDRMPVVHLKDMVILERPKDETSRGHFNWQQMMAEIGEGNLNWPAILKACEEANVEWMAIEQDICQRSPFESLEISYNNLKAMGYQ